MSLEATFFSSYSQWLLAGLIVLIAQTIYVLFGFGLGLVAVGLLALFIQPVTNIVVLILFVALPAEIYVFLKSWKARTNLPVFSPMKYHMFSTGTFQKESKNPCQ